MRGRGSDTPVEYVYQPSDRDNSPLTYVQPPESQMLYKDEAPLEDARRLAELHVENDDILALTFLQEGRVQICYTPTHLCTNHAPPIPSL